MDKQIQHHHRPVCHTSVFEMWITKIVHFLALGANPGSKFTKIGDDLLPTQVYHPTKFHHPASTHARYVRYKKSADKQRNKESTPVIATSIISPHADPPMLHSQRWLTRRSVVTGQFKFVTHGCQLPNALSPIHFGVDLQTRSTILPNFIAVHQPTPEICYKKFADKPTNKETNKQTNSKQYIGTWGYIIRYWVDVNILMISYTVSR